MDKVRYTSLKFKIWEDKQYKLEKQRQHTHIDEIKIELMRKKTMAAGHAVDDSFNDSMNADKKKKHTYFAERSLTLRQDSHLKNRDAADFYAPAHH